MGICESKKKIVDTSIYNSQSFNGIHSQPESLSNVSYGINENNILQFNEDYANK